MLCILRSDKKLTVAYIHRSMCRSYKEVAQDLDIEVSSCISYTQLQRILKKVDYQGFNAINETFFHQYIYKDALEWYAIDGKELRGSIDDVAGEKRGQNVVSRTSHSTKQSSIVGWYNGSKDSEKTVVSHYFNSYDYLLGKYTLDALHLSSELPALIAKKGGIYLMQVKANQKLLLEDCKHIDDNLTTSYKKEAYQKAHGREEIRIGFGYEMNTESLPKRWKETKVKTLIVVERERKITKTQKKSKEKSYWVTNLPLNQINFLELFMAIREHWTIEVHHNTRDKQMGEDNLITRNENQSRFIAVCITLATNLLEVQKVENLTVLREELAYKERNVYHLFEHKRFL
ncbi:ISAs1 family transposase [Bernardetia sp. MNP-M8]|uniref:ISAs1 family transposase n=1 Tax=Bernardetia sp. MNP-M8 TaxID=3127470 RepID=UPI0030D475D4